MTQLPQKALEGAETVRQMAHLESTDDVLRALIQATKEELDEVAGDSYKTAALVARKHAEVIAQAAYLATRIRSGENIGEALFPVTGRRIPEDATPN
ncbi:hypothetical protein [Ralstonia phage P-PSG-11-1]|uniref:Uncharacterized protein n=1 Tax=Ralstonia phage P-PSG-11 TaxID=2652430 RepID=A0A5P8D5X3_9CAUD|nr:hypothetical protein [Ralstonia phage P-PSG-11]QFP93747.1 hypothetical protein [Ralstonia phage P-PSG-11-1]